MSLEINEHREHAEHGATDPFIARVSITIAVLAAAAAVSTSLENLETAATITERNEAVLAQSQASDQWAFYQAKSMKKHIYALAADEGYPNADKYKKTSQKEAQDGDGVMKDAKKFEAKRDELYASSQTHETRHHRLTAGVTLLEMGIAISTIAIITRRTYWWLGSMALGVSGAVLAAGAYLGYGLF